MTHKLQVIFGATWQYLNQGICDASSESVWEIKRFWYLYQINLLENCWIKEISSESYYTQ